jgi:hypothetical protein
MRVMKVMKVMKVMRVIGVSGAFHTSFNCCTLGLVDAPSTMVMHRVLTRVTDALVCVNHDRSRVVK